FLPGGFKAVEIRVVPENATRRQLLENGEVDISTNDLTEEDYASLREAGKLNVFTYPTTRVDWFILNYVTLPLEARQGLCFAFPYDDVVAGVYKNTVTRTGPIPDNILGYDPNGYIFKTDLDQAKTLLATGGFAEGSTITMSVNAESENSKTMAELYQANLAQIGITLDIQVTDLSTQEDMVYGDGPAEDKPHIIGVWAWWPDYNDGWNQLAPNFVIAAAGGGGSNAGYYENPDVESMMTQAQSATDAATLQDLLVKIQQILIKDDPAAIFIGQVLYTTVADPLIKGIVINPLYIEQYMFQWYYKEQA
ncbi:MAG TPA: ABC transporter substrate-binding protein, partial [Thermomicrobiales bacterium]|nr:ABC transporter substrate-binding protein [Thermomicrobiales bacterium]